MDSSHVARRVARKELSLFFASPVAWLFLGGFAAVCLFVVFWVESFFARNIADTRPLFEWMPVLLIFLCSAITMRMWSEERRSGTLEHVLVQPSALWRFSLGKFRACLSLLLLALVATLPLPVTVALLADLDWGPVWGGYLASVLLGSSYLAIGLFVSGRTDNPIVSLLGSVTLCGLLYLLGSDLLTDFFDHRSAELLRQLGSGSRFDSITRGIIDLRDLVYYLSLVIAFLGLNIYYLEREGWARFASTPRQRHWRIGTTLLLANLLLTNLWLAKVEHLRWDITEGRVHSLSQSSRQLVEQLAEPLLIRGYFSARSHPLLAPLVPQLQDLMTEYAAAGGPRVRVEFVDPARNPALEKEANERYGIKPTPFQVTNRYQASLVNGYFTVLVQYGTEHHVLTFSDLIEVRTSARGNAEVLLRNPEFDITRAIRDVVSSYRAGGDLFAGIDRPVEFIGYVSDDERLPGMLVAYRDSIEQQLQRAADAAGGKFSFRFIDPEAGDGDVARQIEEQWGFTPMSSSLDADQAFFFYLTLADDKQVVQLPTGDFDPGSFRKSLDTGLKRFTRDFTKTVALAAPRVSKQMAAYNLGGPGFEALQAAITRNHSIVMEDLGDGEISPEADILVVVAPRELDTLALFALDQFLMRGGTVILATSPFSVEPLEGTLKLRRWNSGLEPWLRHHGISTDESLVLDRRHARFPAPVQRNEGDYQFQDTRIVDYPFFIDIRNSGFGRHPINASLPQLTMAWASPLAIERGNQRRVSQLLWSSQDSWLEHGDDIAPRENDDRSPAGATGRQLLGAILQGRFQSYFQQPPAELGALPARVSAGVNSFVKRSPEAARIIIFASNDFLSDRVLGALVRASGSRYLGPLELLNNSLDWALQDQRLLQIRSRAHFNRTLPPMEQQHRVYLELFNYAAALLWLGVLALVFWIRRRRLVRFYARELGL
ncbi:ABC transporter permease [Seongchinamella sediminis]|uniref:ABC transporter permease n=1 Tax=Seongchinamella sediminis TaxID=2283635 RepID=A0A3L7E1T0_9GAMM|nr:Gldg family protein [Seongchinamella sediminis]RLQ23424.1 ABC transporter permease [Seongchinamella sediminis]